MAAQMLRGWAMFEDPEAEEYERFRTLLEEEGIESFQEYDRKHSIHYYCEDWLEIFQELLQKEDPEGILEDVRGFVRIWEREGRHKTGSSVFYSVEAGTIGLGDCRMLRRNVATLLASGELSVVVPSNPILHFAFCFIIPMFSAFIFKQWNRTSIFSHFSINLTLPAVYSFQYSIISIACFFATNCNLFKNFQRLFAPLSPIKIFTNFFSKIKCCRFEILICEKGNQCMVKSSR